MGYRLRLKYEALRDKHRLRLFASMLIGIQNSRSEIEDDISEIRNDVSFLVKAMAAAQLRIKALDAFVVQTENRLPKILKQLENLTDYDVEYSWDEALALEHKSLTQRSAHAKEELRMLRNALILKRKEQVKLHLELGKRWSCFDTNFMNFLEEAELELDEIVIKEVEVFEMIRRNEIESINRRVIRNRKFRVRREKCFWKVENVRQNLILSHQRGLKRHLLEEVSILP